MPVLSAHNEYATLIYPQGSGPTFDPVTGAISGDLAGARVIVANSSGAADAAQKAIAMGGPSEAFSLGWAATDWIAGTTPGTALAAADGVHADQYKVRNGLRFGGFPYPGGAVASTCG